MSRSLLLASMGRSGLRSWALALCAVCAVVGSAGATVTQPNGTVVPIDSRAGGGSEQQVYDAFKQGDKTAGLRFREDANTAPEVFSPLCSFTAELLLKETASDMAVGWYNVIPGATTKPADTDIIEVIPRGARPPAMISGQSIKDHPKYLGGLIGFAIVTNGLTTKFSERKWNALCTNTTNCPTPGNWVHSITYVSKTIPNAFYLGFEDGNSDADKFGNDGDYNDYFFLFTGLTCNGGGKPCTVPGEKGVCSAGVAECNNAGGLTCKRVIDPQPTEACDGLDNNCDGQIDENATCPAGQECDRGRCATPCSDEFPCPTGLVCDRGRCVSEPCAVGVVCQGDTVCRGDRCVGACDGVICPGGQICRLGRCVNPCSGVSCGAGKACVNGACVTGCDCYPCLDPTLACSKSTNVCVDKGCENLTCMTGYVCKSGECVAGCTGVVCPGGQECKSGQCVDLPMPTDYVPPENTGGAVAEGCSCRLSPSDDNGPSPTAWALLSTVLAAAFLYTRKRRARAA